MDSETPQLRFCRSIPKSVVSTPSNLSITANLARTWIRLADDLERSQAFRDAPDEETEPQRRIGWARGLS